MNLTMEWQNTNLHHLTERRIIYGDRQNSPSGDVKLHNKRLNLRTSKRHILTHSLVHSSELKFNSSQLDGNSNSAKKVHANFSL